MMLSPWTNDTSHPVHAAAKAAAIASHGLQLQLGITFIIRVGRKQRTLICKQFA